VLARVDPGKVHQIIQNLVRNALEATAAGGHVGVELAATGDLFRLRVRDDGQGMSEETRRRIFEPFFSTKESGTGLGMAIVHSFVTMHNGTINVETSPKGTAIEIILPQAT
jgi:signal transduction histidine kinase